MFFKFVLIVLLIRSLLAFNDTNIEEQFFVVSTTPRSSLEVRLTKLENQLKDLSIKTRKEDQNTDILIEIQKSLKNIEKSNFDKIEILKTFTNSSLEARVTKLEDKFKEFSSKIQKEDQNTAILVEIQKFLKNIECSKVEKFEIYNTSINSSLEDRLTRIETQLKNSNASIQKQNQNLANLIENQKSTNSFLESRLTQTENRLKEIQKFLKNTEPNLAGLNVQMNETKALRRDCKDIMSSTNISGVYLIKPESSSADFKVFCDMETHGGGWTYFLNRMDGSEDFYQDWKNYKNGFGNSAGEFWLGLESLYQMTRHRDTELLVEIEDWQGVKAYAHYSSFRIGSEEKGYPLEILGVYNGTASDSLSNDLGQKFSTKDRDQDSHNSYNCAINFHGGFWYNICGYANLCGEYKKGAGIHGQAIWWYKFKNNYNSLKKARMMTRPKEI